jgi:hypothetical protein
MSQSDMILRASVLIERPILDVFYYVCDPVRLSEWVPVYTNIRVEEDYWKHETPQGKTFEVMVGLDLSSFLPGLGRPEGGASNGSLTKTLFAATPFGYSETIACMDVVPGRSISFRSTRFPQTGTYIFDPLSEGTMVTATHSVWGWSSWGPWAWFARPWAQDFLRQTLDQLKFRLEALRGRRPREAIFFFYRREQDRYTGGRICESLSREFGEGAIFRDVDSIDGATSRSASITRSQVPKQSWPSLAKVGSRVTENAKRLAGEIM